MTAKPTILGFELGGRITVVRIPLEDAILVPSQRLVRLRRRIQVNMYYVYVLQSLIFNTRYVGSTADIEKRLIEHNSGRVRYTKGRKPWKLIYSEEFTTRGDARRRELFLKSGQGRKYLDTKLSTVNH